MVYPPMHLNKTSTTHGNGYSVLIDTVRTWPCIYFETNPSATSCWCWCYCCSSSSCFCFFDILLVVDNNDNDNDNDGMV